MDLIALGLAKKYTDEQIGKLSTEQIGKAVDKYFEENPVVGAPGKDGKDGITPEFFIGTVETLEPSSNATASVSGTAAKPILNLGIPKGQDGKTPVRGTDYWTEADRAEMVNEVIASLPVYNGEVVAE